MKDWLLNTLWILGGLFIACNNPTEEKEHTEAEAELYQSWFDTIPYENGKELVSTHCQSCHLSPDISSHSKQSWEHHVMPKMGPFLGIRQAGPSFYRQLYSPNSQDIFPQKPVLSQDEWEQMVSYFVHEAANKLKSPAPLPQIKVELEQFDIHALPSQTYRPYASLVQIDEQYQQIYLGDKDKRSIEVWSPQLKLKQSYGVFDIPAHIRTLAADQFQLLMKGGTDPSDELRGQLARFRDTEKGLFIDGRLIEELPYTVGISYADLNQDGQEDVIISGFGEHLGKLAWYEKKGDDLYQEHLLLDIAGTLQTEVYDFDQNGLADILALVGQGTEAYYLFYNQGNGQFEQQKLMQFLPSFGSSAFQLVDINQDHHIDILHINGQPAAYPFELKPFHGLRIFIGTAQANFQESYFFPLHGATGLEAADYDQDGDIDIALISSAPDYSHRPEEGFVYLENQGNLQFTPLTFEKHPRGKWRYMDAGDMDADGDIDIVLGNSMIGAEKDIKAYQKLWRQGTPALVVLENKLR